MPGGLVNANYQAEKEKNQSIGIGDVTWQPALPAERPTTWLQINYPGDKCDPESLSAVDPTKTDYKPSNGRNYNFCSYNPGPNCGGSSTLGSCGVSRMNAAIEQSFTGGSLFPKAFGWTQERHCPCPQGSTQDFCENDAQLKCGRADWVAAAGTNWQGSTLDETVGQTAVSSGGTAHRFQTEYPSINPKQGNKAKERSLGWRYWDDLQNLPAVSAGTYTVFEGLRWSWVRRHDFISAGAWSDSPSGSSQQQQVRQYVSPTRQVVEESTDVYGPPCNQLLMPWPWPVALQPCMMCDQGYLLIDPTNPTNDSFVQAAVAPVNALSSFGEGPLQILGNTSKSLVMISDAADFAQGSVIGVQVTNINHALQKRISKNGDGTYTLLSTSTSVGTEGVLVAAASGRRQEVTFFGEATANQVRIYDFDLNATRYATLLGPDPLDAPVAATYRAEDDSYYVLDAGLPGQMALVQITRAQTVFRRQLWHRGTHTSFGLTTGRDGSLVISGWSSADYAIAEILPDRFVYDASITTTGDTTELPPAGSTIPASGLHLRALLTGPGGLRAPAIRTMLGISVFGVGASNPVRTIFAEGADRPIEDAAQCF